MKATIGVSKDDKQAQGWKEALRGGKAKKLKPWKQPNRQLWAMIGLLVLATVLWEFGRFHVLLFNGTGERVTNAYIYFGPDKDWKVYIDDGSRSFTSFKHGITGPLVIQWQTGEYTQTYDPGERTGEAGGAAALLLLPNGEFQVIDCGVLCRLGLYGTPDY